jgi:predicted DCC family thiol-disulfide oxidoreductase YuxK
METANIPSGGLAVFYDGGCPLCTREIAFYRRRAGAGQLIWIDLTEQPEGEVAPGLDRRAALSRFHVLDDKGRLLSGGSAFAALWLALPAFRLVGLLFRLPLMARLLDAAYDGFLRLRPLIARAACPLGNRGAQ